MPDQVKARQMFFALQKAMMTFVEEYTRATGVDEISDKELLAAGVGFKQIVDLTIEENTKNQSKMVKEGSLRLATSKEYVNITPQRPTITPTGANYQRPGNARRHP
jgi:hypothetical protein